MVVLVFNLRFPIDAIPQDAALRFGLPMVVLLAVVAGERWPRLRRFAECAALLVVGCPSIWSLEGFVYTARTFAAMACLQAWLKAPGGRLRWLGAAGHPGGGRLPLLPPALRRHDPGGKRSVSRTGASTWPTCAPSSSGASGTSPTTSALVSRASRSGPPISPRRPRSSCSSPADRGSSERERIAVVALAGMTTYGVALYSYFDNRSTANT